VSQECLRIAVALLWADLKHSPAATIAASCTGASCLSRAAKIAVLVQNQTGRGKVAVRRTQEAVYDIEGTVLSLVWRPQPKDAALQGFAIANIRRAVKVSLLVESETAWRIEYLSIKCVQNGFRPRTAMLAALTCRMAASREAGTEHALACTVESIKNERARPLRQPGHALFGFCKRTNLFRWTGCKAITIRPF
jgi:hypothetical protein